MHMRMQRRQVKITHNQVIDLLYLIELQRIFHLLLSSILFPLSVRFSSNIHLPRSRTMKQIRRRTHL